MLIRKAEEKDIPRILELLGQVLQIHADIRPDTLLFRGTTKYTTDELTELFRKMKKSQYMLQWMRLMLCGVCICQLKEQSFSNNMVPLNLFYR